MNKITRPSIFSVSSHEGFADILAAYFLKKYGKSTFSLADGLILLPNNRALKAIEEAFIRKSGSGLLLPKMVTIGDLELNEKVGIFIDQFDDETILAAINPMQRHMLLAKLIEKHHESLLGRPIDAAQAINLALDFAKAVDQLDVEEIDFSRLSELPARADMAVHWRKSYDLFEVIYQEYQKILQDMKLTSMVLRRNALIRNMAQSLDKLSTLPFIAAVGVTTSAPAIAYLLRYLARHDNGMVILPHVDQMMEENVWQSLGPHEKNEENLRVLPSIESHPQFHLKALLDRMGFARSDIMLLEGSKSSQISDRKDNLISHIFMPAKKTSDWQSIDVNAVDFKHINVMTLKDSAAEAQAVALLVRKNLEIRGKRIAIVTPDRELARRISAHLLRWNIKADDSAGIALCDSSPGNLLLLIAKICSNDFAPIDLLSVLKHPLVAKGEGRMAWLEKIRLLDIALRGERIGQGVSIPQNKIKSKIKKLKLRKPDSDLIISYEQLLDWWNDLKERFSPILNAKTSMELMLEIRVLADYLTDEQIWHGEAGRELSQFYTETLSYIEQGPSKVDIKALTPFLKNLMDGYALRSAYGSHPRVAIYGLLEARLQRSDMIICAGLNEGSWPQNPNMDPWLAPGIRRDIGLPSLERNIGLSAHDLSEALGAKEVVLSRCERDSNGPTVTSRFLLRLMAFAGEKLKYDTETISLVSLIDKPELIRFATEPMPKPSFKQRNIRLNVTDMDKIKADPFAFYAQKIMGLGKLEGIDADVSAAWRGTMVHKILEKWVREDQFKPEKLKNRAEELLTNDALNDTVKILWKPRLYKQIEFVAAQTKILIEENGRKIIAAETSGTMEIVDGVYIKGMADRIDCLDNGKLAIIDYKTGVAPSNKQIKAGFALQLGLLGSLAENGKFNDINGDIITSKCGAFEYWSFAKKGGDFGVIQYATRDELTEKNEHRYVKTDEFITLSKDYAKELIDKYIRGDEVFRAQLHPEYALYNDYAHFSRLMEWYGKEGEQ